MDGPKAAGRLAKRWDGVVGESRPDWRRRLGILGGRSDTVEHPGLLRDAVTQGCKDTAQRGEGSDLRMSAERHVAMLAQRGDDDSPNRLAVTSGSDI